MKDLLGLLQELAAAANPANIKKLADDASSFVEKTVKNRLTEMGLDATDFDNRERRFKKCVWDDINGYTCWFYNDGTDDGLFIIGHKTPVPNFKTMTFEVEWIYDLPEEEVEKC